MTQAIVASIPIDSRFVPSCLETIIDKKVSGVALNFLEKLVDCLFTWFYCPYHSLYQAKTARVHFFGDGEAKLYDTTKQGVGAIERNGSITLNERKVFFNLNPNIESVFSRQAFTDYVVIKDDEKRRPGWFQIIEQEISRPNNPKPMEKSWTINTNRFGQILGQENVYLVERPRSLMAI